MTSEYDLARDLVDEFEDRDDLFETDCGDFEECGSVHLTDAGRDWLIQRIERALREARAERK